MIWRHSALADVTLRVPECILDDNDSAPHCARPSFFISPRRDMGAAAAVILRKEHDVVASFRGAGATTPANARSPEELGLDRHLVFHRLVTRAVLREADEGRFYLDEPSWHALRGFRRRMVMVMLVVLFAMILIGVVSF
jgi:hypothetical protein